MMLIGCVICKLNALITFWSSKMVNNLNHSFSQKTTSFSSFSPGFHMGLRKAKWGTVGTRAEWSGAPHVQGTHTWLYSCQPWKVTNRLVFNFFLKMLARQGEKMVSSTVSHLNIDAIFFIFLKAGRLSPWAWTSSFSLHYSCKILLPMGKHFVIKFLFPYNL